jgi:phenylacetate-CoA ligase
LRNFRDARVRSLVQHAYDSVPFYHAWFDRHGIKPRDVAGVADLAVIPPVSKADLLDLPREALLAAGTDPEQLIERRTSGSSGEIFTSWRSRSEEWLAECLRFRIKAYHGLRPTDRQMRIVVGPPALPQLQRLERVMRRLKRLYRVDPTEPPEKLRQQFLAIGPDVLTGIAGTVSRLAESLAADGPPWFRRPRHVITGAEVLTPSMRHRITSVFGAPVYERYACNELDQLAYQCRHGDELHTCDESVVVEVLRNGTPAKPGERGELIATALHFRAMPFIRYRLGDVVTRGADRCPCGVPFGTIRGVQGRMNDYFHLPDGRMIHPYRLAAGTTGRVGWIREFQVTQETRNLIVASVVASANPTEEELAPLRSMVEAVLGPDVELRIALVPEIDWGKGGKHRLFRSRVASDYDEIDWEGMEPDALPAAPREPPRPS